jgi:glycosyltransferase involved in cell wall biosynthesis
VTEVHVVVPAGIDDPARPSGGNVYDRRVCRELAGRGWTVYEHRVAGAWPQPGAADHAALAEAVERVPDGATVLLDGLVACAAPEALAPHDRRLAQVVLVHMPLGHRPTGPRARERERAVLLGATAVITTSGWTQRRLIELYGLTADRVHVAEPGVDAAAVAPGRPDGTELLCVAAVTRDKGHDLLLEALADVSCRCTCVGSLSRAPAFADALRRRVPDGRVRFTGPRTGAQLDRAYADADLLVLPSRAETYGMVVTEALARGLPVLATDVGGVSEALGRAPDGTRPGLLIAPDDDDALAEALRAWLGDPALRERLRRAARARRATLRRWSDTASVIAGVLASPSPTPTASAAPDGGAR